MKLDSIVRERPRLQSFLALPVVSRGVAIYRENLTARGRYLLWITAVAALLGLNTRENHVYALFAAGAAVLLSASVFALWPAPRAQIACTLPSRATASAPVSLRVRVENRSSGLLKNLFLHFPLPKPWGGAVRFRPGEVLFSSRPGEVSETSVSFSVSRRGRYVLQEPALRATDPLGLVGGRSRRGREQAVLVYPRYYTMAEFMVPAGRRYQPGGIPLASATGDSVEFIGTREYQQGDPVKNIHWRSWARLGKPVVKEFQEEYFCRLALILDTFLPRRPRKQEVEAFEAAVSVVASIADFFSRSEHIVDILAAGPEIYEVSAGRSLAYLENILDVLACLEPCYEPPFQTVGPALFDKLAQITSVVAVLQDWDNERETFLRKVRSMGAEVRAIIVKGGDTRRPWQGGGEGLGATTVMSPADVERLLAAETV